MAETKKKTTQQREKKSVPHKKKMFFLHLRQNTILTWFLIFLVLYFCFFF